MYTSCRRITTISTPSIRDTLHYSISLPDPAHQTFHWPQMDIWMKWCAPPFAYSNPSHHHVTYMMQIWIYTGYLLYPLLLLTQTNSNTLSQFLLSCGFYCITLFACHELLTTSHHVLAREGKEEDDQLGEEACIWSQWSCICHRIYILT